MLQNSVMPAVSPTERRSFVVAQNKRGQWVVRESHGLIEGVFVTQRDAIRFALFESGSRGAVVGGGHEGSRH